MGVTVRQKHRGPGRPWHVFIHQDGTIRSRKVGTKRDASIVAIAIRRKLVKGGLGLEAGPDPPEETAPEFIAYAEHYLETYAKVACKRNTYKSYEVIVRKHLAGWRGKRLDEITRADVKRLILRKQQEGYSPSTAQNIKGLISGIFTHAYEDEILSANPALKLGRYIKKQDRRKHVRPLTRDQVAAFLTAAQQHQPEHHPMLLCAFRTGMRLGELLGLAWQDIDFDAGTIEVRRAYSHGHWSTPKSHRSRYIDLSNQLRITLQAHRKTLLARFSGRLKRVPVPDGLITTAVHLVFPSRDGGALDGDNFRRRVFYPLLEKADVPKIRFHDIRHTFASLLLQQGEPLHYVKEQMGHASIQTTVDVYGHLVPGSNRNAVNRLDDPSAPQLKIVPAAG